MKKKKERKKLLSMRDRMLSVCCTGSASLSALRQGGYWGKSRIWCKYCCTAGIDRIETVVCFLRLGLTTVLRYTVLNLFIITESCRFSRNDVPNIDQLVRSKESSRELLVLFIGRYKSENAPHKFLVRGHDPRRWSMTHICSTPGFKRPSELLSSL